MNNIGWGILGGVGIGLAYALTLVAMAPEEEPQIRPQYVMAQGRHFIGREPAIVEVELIMDRLDCEATMQLQRMYFREDRAQGLVIETCNELQQS